MSYLETSIETATELEPSGASGTPHGYQMLMDTTSSSSSAESKRCGGDIAGTAVVTILFVLVVANLYFFVSYSDASSCSGDNYSIRPNVWCLVAGLCSIPTFIIAFKTWRKSRLPQNSGSCVFCMSFWNTVWSILGLSMYVLQFNDDCKVSAIGFWILIWCSSQVSNPFQSPSCVDCCIGCR